MYELSVDEQYIIFILCYYYNKKIKILNHKLNLLL